MSPVIPTPATITLNNGSLLVTFDATGPIDIVLNGQQILTHPAPTLLPMTSGLSLYNPINPVFSSTNFYVYPSCLPPVGSLLRSSLVSSSTIVTITHIYPTIEVVYTYTLSQHNLNVSINVINGPYTPIMGLTFTLPTFLFNKVPSGNMHMWQTDYMNEIGTNFYHPSAETPLAVAYAYDTVYGLAIHSKTHFKIPTMLNANAGSGMVNPYLFVSDAIAPNATYNIALTIRCINVTDLPTILAQYIADYQQVIGGLQYTPDDRPVIQCCPEDASWVTANSPLGLYDPSRRFDLPAGIPTFEAMIAASVGITQGTIFWQPQGYNPRGGAYRPDFDVWPAAVAANLPTLISWFKSNSLSFGLCARPGQMVSPVTATADGTCDIDYRNTSQMTMLLQRFKNVIAQGISSFYLDSFGGDLNSYHIMIALRGLLGVSVPTYTEFTTDIMLPLSGVYCELQDNNGDTDWYNAETMQVFRLLQPKSSVIALSKVATTPATAANNLPGTSMDVYGKLKLTPIIEDWTIGGAVSQLQYLLTTYFNGKNWK